jgi:hypothetical protein
MTFLSDNTTSPAVFSTYISVSEEPSELYIANMSVLSYILSFIVSQPVIIKTEQLQALLCMLRITFATAFASHLSL